MKVRKTTKNKELVFEFECADTKAAYDEIAGIEEIFEQESCGKCKSNDFKFSKRNVKNKYVYREIVCRKCHHRLSLGQQQKSGSLFPQRKNKDGNDKPNFGWVLYNPEDDDE